MAHTETAPSHASSSLQRTVTVHFPINSHQLKGGEKIKIRAAQTSLRSSAHISVTGYTCDLGTERYNDLLAMKRAKTVAGFLRTLGVPADRLEISGKGSCCYASEARAGNRRVEITSDSP